jgi:branched-subunit amino acid transport protein|tara:strand:+ start:9455 stop:9661 length:207 start_codon:yes stop_codon:yes gene_type:complete
MSKDKVASIFRKWWFNAALFGVAAGFIFLLTKNIFLTGMTVGMGIMFFIRLFKDNLAKRGVSRKVNEK